MDISSFPCTQLVFAFSLGWTLKEVNINGDFNQYIWAFSLGWTQETDVRVTSSSLLISSGKPEEVFPTNIFSVLNECPTIIYWAKIIQYNPHSISTKPFLSPLIFYWAVIIHVWLGSCYNNVWCRYTCWITMKHKFYRDKKYYCPLNMFLCRIIRFLAKDKPPLKR